LAQGVLRDDQAAALFDECGKEIPLQTESLARWPDGSIRWLLLDFQIDLAAKQKKTLTLRYGPGTRRAPVEKPVRITKQADGTVVIEPGPVRLEYNSKSDKGIFFPHGDAWLIDHSRGRESRRRLTYNCVADGVLIADRDHAYKPRIEDIAIEQSGPVRVCIRASGSHVGGDSKMFRYVARVHAWRGQPYVRVFYTFINDRQDALTAKIESLRVFFYVFAGEAWGLFDGKLRKSYGGELFQVDEAHCRYTGDSLPGEIAAARRAMGWAALSSEDDGLAVGLREFWQNWPKAIECEPDHITLALCPQFEKGLYDGKPLEEENKLYYALRGGQYTFKVGVAKTHEFWVRYLDGKPDATQLGKFFQATEEPLLAVADPVYVQTS
jgi:hypothetical protein